MLLESVSFVQLIVNIWIFPARFKDRHPVVATITGKRPLLAHLPKRTARIVCARVSISKKMV